MNGPWLNRPRTHPAQISSRRIVIAGLAGALLFGCKLDGSEPEQREPEPQPQPAASVTPAAGAVAVAPAPAPNPTAGPAAEPKPGSPAEIDQLRDENRQLMQALEVTLANQQDLASQLRKTNEALAEIRGDVALLRERLRDLELAQESHPLPQRTAGAAEAVAQQR